MAQAFHEHFVQNSYEFDGRAESNSATNQCFVQPEYILDTMQFPHHDHSNFAASYQTAQIIVEPSNFYAPAPQYLLKPYDPTPSSPGGTPPLSPDGTSSPTASEFSIDQPSVYKTAAPVFYPFECTAEFIDPLTSCVPQHNPSDAIPPTTNNTFTLTSCEFDYYLTDLLDQIQTTQDMNHPVLAAALTGPEESHLRSLLHEIVKSDWFRSNKFEPKTEKGRSVFLSFLASDAAGAYRCLFKECSKNLDRQDRALGHIRMHLGHRPHACGGKCGVMGCQERFYCASYLRSHTKRQKEPCEICQESFFRQHLRKHRLVCQGAQQKLAMQVANEEFLAYMTSTS